MMSQHLRESFEAFEPYIKDYKELTDGQFKGAKLYKVRAIHVTMTGNRRLYTSEELLRGSRSLSDRPIAYGSAHPTAPNLPWPANSTVDAEYNDKERFTETIVRVSDPTLNQLIAEKKVTKVSIEGHGRDQREVDGVAPLGVVFTRLLFVTEGAQPGDPATSIEPITFSELLEPVSEPMGSYKDFADCVAKNNDKKDPEAYCATIMRKVEGKETVQSDAPPIGGSQDIIEEKKMSEKQLEDKPVTTFDELMEAMSDEPFESIEEVKKWLQKVRKSMVAKGTVGAFTAKAKAAGMAVAAYARKILANKSKYDTKTIRQAVFALRAQKGFKATVDEAFINEVLAKPLDDFSDLNITSEERPNPAAAPIAAETPAILRTETGELKTPSEPEPKNSHDLFVEIKKIHRKSIEKYQELESTVNKMNKALLETVKALKTDVDLLRRNLEDTKVSAATKTALAEALNKINVQDLEKQKGFAEIGLKLDKTIAETKQAILARIEAGEIEKDGAMKKISETLNQTSEKFESYKKTVEENLQATMKSIQESQTQMTQLDAKLGDTTKIAETVKATLVDRKVLSTIPFKGQYAAPPVAASPTKPPETGEVDPWLMERAWGRKQRKQ